MDMLGPNTERLLEIDSRMESFALRDLQHLAVLVTWGIRCGFSVVEIVSYAAVAATLRQLIAANYFAPSHTIKQLKAIKSLERALPKHIRKDFRGARLARSRYGIYERGG